MTALLRGFCITALCTLALVACGPGSNSDATTTDGGNTDGMSGSDATTTDATTTDGGGTDSMVPGVPAAGLFWTVDDLNRARMRMNAPDEPFATSYTIQAGRASTAMGETADPFVMADVSTIVFGWCGDSDGIDNSLSDLTGKLEDQSDAMRTLAMEFALTSDAAFGDKSVEMIRAWADNATLVNMYDFNIDFTAGSFDGITMGGFCSSRPWNFALDAMWQAYGLVNIADAYLLLTLNGYTMDPADDAAIRAFILELTEAVNASFHAWTRWADEHPSSSSFERYRTDNHLSWALAGLIAGAVALDDAALAAYVLDGGSWTDSRGTSYTNPSYIGDVLDRAIESGTGAANEGRIYEELILRDPPIGYALFHLWAMMLVAQTAEIHHGRDLWTLAGADGGDIHLAYDRYAGFILGEDISPEPTQEGDLTVQAWLYELAYRRWGTQRYADVINAGSRISFIIQSIGPVALALGEILP